MEGIEVALIGGIGILIILPLILSKLMDDFLKNKKEILMHWRHFWISISIGFSVLLTSLMQAFMQLNKAIIVAEYKALDDGIEALCESYCDVFNTISTVQMTVLMIWFSYLAIITVIFYINKLSNAGDKAEYE